MSKYDIPTVETECPACAADSVHRITFENTAVRHLRCDACEAVHVCATKGSFQAAIHPIAFDKLSADGGEAEAYSIQSAFHPASLFSHPKFGVGYVFAILSPPQKMEVIFADKVRFLVCGPGSGVPIPETEAHEELIETEIVQPAESSASPDASDSADPAADGSGDPVR